MVIDTLHYAYRYQIVGTQPENDFSGKQIGQVTGREIVN